MPISNFLDQTNELERDFPHWRDIEPKESKDMLMIENEYSER